jgi:tripartite-type tricarboxylate transporter receptor subunit TctC
MLGISGHNSVRGFPTLISQGFGATVANISVPFHLVVPASMPQDRFNEWRQILVEAGKNSSVKETYKSDACVPGNLTDADLPVWYRNQVEQWHRFSAGVKITP